MTVSAGRGPGMRRRGLGRGYTGRLMSSEASTNPTKLPAKYRPADHEPSVRERWERSRAFHAVAERVLSGERPPYCIFIPPPNVTARLHLGHALNNTIQDVLSRAHRMKGFEVLWMPGTDHAGIATQTVVEQRLLKEEGKRRADFAKEPGGREKFVARVQAWKDEYEAAITDQLRQMGCSCDWDRQRFTMDEVCARAVREAFFRLFRDGLIYRGKRLVNWDPATQTALADDEVEMEEIDGAFYYLRYPLVRGSGASHVPVTWSELGALGYPGASKHPGDERAWVTVATTRPETYLGDTAVAINPQDPRAGALRGMHVQLPLVGRVIPIVEDDYVVRPLSAEEIEAAEKAGTPIDPKAKFATGFLKVTPAHDPNDWEIGQRHKLAVINVMAPDASISDKHGWTDVGDAHLFVGLSREDARKKVVGEFKARGLLEQVKPYRHSVGHSYRSHVPIEPYLSDQWYCRVTDKRLSEAAVRAMTESQRGSKPAGIVRPSNSGTGLQPVQSAGITRELTIHRRHLPHWQRGGSTYFVTFRLAYGALSEAERTITLEACKHWHGERAIVRLVVVMPDHVHMLVTPMQRESGEWHPLSELIGSIKRHAAREINKQRGREGPLWQDEYFDRIIRDADEFTEKWNYMVNNPVAAGLVLHNWEYGFTWKPQDSDDGLQARPTQDDEVTDGDGAMTFFPERYAKPYEAWHENLRDWCISRQLWWGHRIPVWHIHLKVEPDPTGQHPGWLAITCNGLDHALGGEDGFENTWLRMFDSATGRELSTEEIRRMDGVCEDHECLGEYDAYVCSTNPEAIKYFEEGHDFWQGHGLKQDPDVLDTWFSSALWPISTLGWPDPPAEMKGLLEAFNPSSVLSTAREIITLWVSRMVMFNRYLLPEVGSAAPGKSNNARPTAARDYTSPDSSGRGDGPVPFRHVYIHAVVQDGHGQRMSKSLGNGVDPLDIVHSHGTDALRFILAQTATGTQDVRLPVDLSCPHCNHAFEPAWITSPAGYKVAAPHQTCPSCKKTCVSAYGVSSGSVKATADEPQARNSSTKFDSGRNFCTKLWNATKFTLMNLEGGEGAPHATPTGGERPRTLIDRWMLSRVARTTAAIDEALAGYQFAAYTSAVYDLFWRDFCDWYLEAIKPTVRHDATQRAVLRAAMDSILRLLHPLCPYVTETLWDALRELAAPAVHGLTLADGDLLCVAGWPVAHGSLIDEKAEREFERVRTLVEAVREVRASKGVEPRRRPTLHVPAELARACESAGGLVETMAQLGKITTDAPPAGGTAAVLVEGLELVLSDLADEADPAAERENLSQTIVRLDKEIATLDGRLSNPGYAAKAPAKLVEETKQTLAQKRREREAAAARLAQLG
jgi:valyl-tRNA synthetase